MHSALLEKYITHIKPKVAPTKTACPVLDLACGLGRNGLFCVANNITTVFADRNSEALATIKQTLSERNIRSGEGAEGLNSLANTWLVDFEENLQSDKPDILLDNRYSAILVFRYLHRPLISQIKNSVIKGGYVIYETFTVDQPQFGRPKNPDFLLKSGELVEMFADWEIIHSFEGIKASNTSNNQQAIAQIVARKP